jgi:hypothetical protein
MKVRDLFDSDVTRDISPVVYFHEQSPEKLAQEVGEYIITGGLPDGHPHKERVPNGIHEQYVKLLSAITSELGKRGGPELPAAWISGFYGSGKSSFAKLLGLALDGVALPDKSSLAEALLARDTTPRASELRAAYKALRTKIEPMSVVFDIGGAARDNESVHSVVVRHVQKRLGYSRDPFVAEMELRLERDGQWKAFEAAAAKVLGVPWKQAVCSAMADDQFSQVLHGLHPDRYVQPMSWLSARAGTSTYSLAVEDATNALSDMLKFRASDKTLFLVIDEVSQYIHQDSGRMLKLQAFVSDVGQRLKGRVWLLVTGQQKLEEGGDQNVLGKMKDRFPEKLRVHLAASNIRDVVHKRLLHKSEKGASALRDPLIKHRNDLKLFAYGCDEVTIEDLIEVYPLLPGHIDLILQITSALRSRSSRSQGDDQAIRGLLQLLGELFRGKRLADRDVGALVTLDEVYDIQHTALDSDVQGSMGRVLSYCGKNSLELGAKAAKAVALLELIQDTVPTDAALVARCLYDRLDRGSREEAVRDALEQLRRQSLLGYSEKHGYKIQSSAGEEWQRERTDLRVSADDVSGHIQTALGESIKELEGPELAGRKFSWFALLSDGRSKQDVQLAGSRDPGSLTLDLRYLPRNEQDQVTWSNRSAESSFNQRIVWVCGDIEDLKEVAQESARSAAMVKRYAPKRESLTHDRQRLLFEEEVRRDELARAVRRAAESTWQAGSLYFAGARFVPRELGESFGQALTAIGERTLPQLFAHFVATRVTAAEVMQLIEPQLNAPSTKFVKELGILRLDAGKYEPSCHGVVPGRILEHITHESGVAGTTLLETFGGAPYGYSPEVVRACVAGLLRAHKVRIQTESGQSLSAVRDAGVRDVFEKERGFKRAAFFPSGDDPTKPQTIARLCKFFEKSLHTKLDREPDAVADAIASVFPSVDARLRNVFEQLRKLPGDRQDPPALVRLHDALTRSVASSRYTEQAVRECVKQLDALQDGIQLLGVYASELDDQAVRAVRALDEVSRYQTSQLEALDPLEKTLSASSERIREQLSRERPWSDAAALDSDLTKLREAYVERRRSLLQEQERAAENVRRAIKARDGFATLTADQSHHVLRPITESLTNSDEAAVSPPLIQLRDGYLQALGKAEEDANARLDAILSQGKEPMIRKVEHQLRNREIRDVAELEAVLEELRTRISEQLKAGGRVRLV